MSFRLPNSLLFFFNDTAPTEIYPLSLHDALPIYTEALQGAKTFALWPLSQAAQSCFGKDTWPDGIPVPQAWLDRKSTRLNFSHLVISYAVFCLKKKNNNKPRTTH